MKPSYALNAFCIYKKKNTSTFDRSSEWLRYWWNRRKQTSFNRWLDAITPTTQGDLTGSHQLHKVTVTRKTPNNLSLLGGNGNTLKKDDGKNLNTNKPGSPVSHTRNQQKAYSQPPLFLIVHYSFKYYIGTKRVWNFGCSPSGPSSGVSEVFRKIKKGGVIIPDDNITW